MKIERVYKANKPTEIRKVICPKCEENVRKSRVRWNGGESVGVPEAVDSFWDELGKYHKHDPRIAIDRYKCSNGHVFSIQSRQKCWCGWLFEGSPPGESDLIARVGAGGNVERELPGKEKLLEDQGKPPVN